LDPQVGSTRDLGVHQSWGKNKNKILKIKFPNPTNQTHIKTKYNFETYYGFTIIKEY
jgi:hypothetical protein